jgi:hypothetical protein
VKSSVENSNRVVQRLAATDFRAHVGLARRACPGIVVLAAIVLIALPCWPQKTPKKFADSITLVDVTSRMHLSVPPLSHPPSADTFLKPIKSGEYSVDFARRILIPAIGGSVVAADVDGSGYFDLYVIVPGGSNHYLRNLKNGTFAEDTSKAGLAGTGSDLSATFGDYDHSGHVSFFVAGLGGVTVYQSNGDGTFINVTEKTGIKIEPGELATSVLLFDAEGNGNPDLLVTVYTDLGKPPAKPSFVFPNDFASATSRLYHNQGDGTFREITSAAGLQENPGRTHKALAADFGHSGHIDLLLLRDNKPPVLFKNKGQGVFEDRTWQAGGENWKYAYVDGQLSDFDHDGKLDLALWSTIGNEVLMNQGDGKFEQAKTFPIVFAANRAFGFHGATADLTGDGYDDLLMVDNNSGWHFIANQRGEFALGDVKLPAATAKSRTGSAKPALPPLSSLTPVRVDKSEKITLIGIQTDGRIIALEPRQQPVHATSRSSPSHPVNK